MKLISSILVSSNGDSSYQCLVALLEQTPNRFQSSVAVLPRRQTPQSQRGLWVGW